MQNNYYEENSGVSGVRKLFNGKWAAMVILACFVVFRLLSNSSGIELEFSDAGFTLSYSDAEEFFVAFEDIEEIEYVEAPDYGTLVSGETSTKYSYGTWENSAWGTYSLAVFNKVDSCVVIHATDGIYAFNYEDSGTTTSIYNSLVEFIGQKA